MPDPTPTPPQGEGFRIALADALARLKTAERTASELRAALSKKHPSEEVEAVLALLAEKRLLSEDRAAEAIVRPRAQGRRAEGDTKLRERLERRGATEEAIEKALAAAPDEAQRADDALTAKFRREEGQLAKAGRFLLARGFDEEAVDSALARFFGA